MKINWILYSVSSVSESDRCIIYFLFSLFYLPYTHSQRVKKGILAFLMVLNETIVV